METEMKMYRSHEVKATSSDDGKMRFEGYLAYFGNVDSYGDVIEKGAFAKTISDAKSTGKTIPVLEQHGGWGINSTDMTPIGHYEDMWEDDKGLYAKGVLFSTAKGKDMYTLLKEAPKGAMGQSIGYRTMGYRKPTDEEQRATGVKLFLTEIKLMEGSVVTFPANDKARVEDVKAEAQKRRNLEKHFKEHGFSSQDSVKIVALIRDMGLLKDMQEDQEEKSTETEGQDLTVLLEAVKSSVNEISEAQAHQELKRLLDSFK